ncbi:MAG TPA: tRNA lysidine(34) synthetase TilS [Candidatus Acidoferrales bacterium]
MLIPLEQRVLANIRGRRMLNPGDRAGVAVSGGADSVGLLRLLERLRSRLGIALLVVHFDHGLRGAESDADAEFVIELARRLELECVMDHGDVSTTASKNKWNLEDAGRRMRYAFFERLVAKGKVTRVAVAHTEDDQAETVLAHLLRGTGPTGLSGIHPEAGPIVRPLLSERREAVRQYLRETDQPWREDSTNFDVRRVRARVRGRLLPMLERDFANHVTKRLAALAGLAREEQVFWNALVEDRLETFVHRDDGKLSIGIGDLLAPIQALLQKDEETGGQKVVWQRALTERLVRRLYEDVHGTRVGLGLSHVEQVIHLARESRSGSRLELPGGVAVERNFAELVFLRATDKARGAGLADPPGVLAGYEYPINLPIKGTTSILVPVLKRRFSLKMIDWSIAERDTKRDWVALDAALLRSPLILRNWRSGDTYRPLGRRHRAKLKEMFRVRKVPNGERALWPVLETAGNVIWTRGMPVAHGFSTGQQTQFALLIEEGAGTV